MRSDFINRNILIIDDDDGTAGLLLETLAGKNLRGTVAENPAKAEDYINSGCGIWDLVLIGSDFSDRNGSAYILKLMSRIKADNPELPVMLLGSSDQASKAAWAIKAGFEEYITKPVCRKHFCELLEIYCPDHQTASIAAIGSGLKNLNIIGTSREIEQTVEFARRVSQTSVPVLITGESGTGKELIAKLIHNSSRRSEGPFIKVNCAALNESILESELFGHEKGAFTGATHTRRGKFECAHGGTLLLDEITETPPRFQAKLLRVLEEMDFQRVGGSEDININVRIISTTNTDIYREIENNTFRADLYYRLAGIKLAIPPLRHRQSDVIPLVWHFINQFSAESRRRITSIDTGMLEALENYHWPGNVRQLRNIIRAALIFGSGEILSLSDADGITEEMSACSENPQDNLLDLAGINLQQLEQQAIIATLRQNDFNQAKTAKELGISDRTLREKIKKYRSNGHLEPALAHN